MSVRRRTAIALLASAVAAAPAFAGSPAQPPGGGVAVLDIPYVPQSEALCGGAAVAMVFRYWGARGVVAEDFASLLDPDESGIRVDRLADGVRARGWQAVALEGNVAMARGQLARHRPVIALVSVGHGRFHYVVIAAWSDRGVIVHDPARAPDRVYRPDQFESAWADARHWMLVITPSPDAADTRGSPRAEAPTTHRAATPCDDVVEKAVARAKADDASAGRVLSEAMRECPGSAAAHRELAGYKLVHGAPGDAIALAADAVRLDAGDAHAWYLLGAARYLAHNPKGALDAWNRIGEPRLDLISVEGLGESSYRSVADVVDLTHGQMITSRDVATARRRIADLPALAASRVDIEPRGQGLAQVDVGVVERSTAPTSRVELAIAGARAAIDREISETFTNLDGSGDAWTGSWRWWNNRPRVAFSVAAPGLLGSHAVWRVEGAWEAQSYGAGATVLRTERTHAGLTAADWITPGWRWQAASGIDRWTGTGALWFGGGGLARRTSDDRLEIAFDATAWAGATRFAQARATAAWVSRTPTAGWRLLLSGGGSAATAEAPFDLWEGAGVGHARAALLRAHPLLDDGIVTGPAFGRAIEHATASVERWPTAGRLWGIGAAGFVDVASVQHQVDPARATSQWFVDAGAGVRVRAAWLPGILRVDYAHGLRDGANAVSVGWQPR